MNAQKEGKMILAAAGAMLDEAALAGIMGTKHEKTVDSMNCVDCNKPTRSHVYGSVSLCHVCWSQLRPDQVRDLERVVELHKLEPRVCRTKILRLLHHMAESSVMYCERHNNLLRETRGVCPDCNAEGDANAQAESDAAGAQAEYEAACRDQAEYDAQQAADEAYHHNQGGQDGYDGP